MPDMRSRSRNTNPAFALFKFLHFKPAAIQVEVVTEPVAQVAPDLPSEQDFQTKPVALSVVV